MPDEPDDISDDDFGDEPDEVWIPVTGDLTRNLFPRFNLFAPNLGMNLFDEQTRRNFASLMPKLDVKLFPDMSAHLRGLLFPDLRETMAPLFERIREWMPPNWPTGIDHKQVVKVFQDEGLPIVWVPRCEIVEEMLAAPDRDSRVGILLAHPAELVGDCRDVFAAVTHPRLAGQLPLVGKAIDAFEAGHQEAAQALAVVATETVVARALGGYKTVKQQVLFDPERVTISQLRLRAALAPIGAFYTTWYPSSGTPAPAELSRHVTVHQADLGHYTPGNAVVAVLLAASVIRAIQELYEIVDRQGQATLGSSAGSLPTSPPDGLVGRATMFRGPAPAFRGSSASVVSVAAGSQFSNSGYRMCHRRRQRPTWPGPATGAGPSSPPQRRHGAEICARCRGTSPSA